MYYIVELLLVNSAACLTPKTKPLSPPLQAALESSISHAAKPTSLSMDRVVSDVDVDVIRLRPTGRREAKTGNIISSHAVV